jgi:hypothetical protein
MAMLLMIGLGLGYGLSVWFLWRQMHFDGPTAAPKGKTSAGPASRVRLAPGAVR